MDKEQNSYGVVMDGIYTVRKDFVESFPLHSEGVPIKPQDMIGVNGTNSLLYSLVECRKPDMLWIARLIEGVISGDPRVRFIPGCDLFP
jgi:hypothetical protein